jgi:hypothetical protein
MATLARQRRGRSGERAVANGHMDFQAAVMDQLDGLAAARWLEGRDEQVRRLYVGRLQELRPIQRAWQGSLERQVRQAEGFGAPRSA